MSRPARPGAGVTVTFPLPSIVIFQPGSALPSACRYRRGSSGRWPGRSPARSGWWSKVAGLGRDLEYVARVPVQGYRIGAVAVGRDTDGVPVYPFRLASASGLSGLPPTEILPFPTRD